MKISIKILILSLVCILAMTACSSNKRESDRTKRFETYTEKPKKTEKPTVDEEEPEKSFLVGAIYINSQNDTAGYTFAHHTGITKAMSDLGMDESQLKIIDNVPEDDMLVSRAIDNLASQGCKLIIGTSFGYINAMYNAAAKPEYKDIIFSHATGYLSNDENFNNYFGRIYQAQYLAGIAAGMKSLELKNNNLGYVASYGTELAETCSGINAFALGAQSVNPDAILYVGTIRAWADEQKERQIAENLIANYNCGIIGQNCDSAQAQLVAQEKGVFGCGYNSDMTPNAPYAHLTAPVWNWDVYYKLAIETAMNTPEDFMSKVGVYYGGLKEGFVDITPLTNNCAKGTKTIVEKVKNMMIKGEWDVFTNIKLNIDADGNIIKTTSAMFDNEFNEVISADGKTYFVKEYSFSDNAEIFKPVEGGKEAQDGVIKGLMNYYVLGVQEIG